jgi:hypothetical protein
MTPASTTSTTAIGRVRRVTAVSLLALAAAACGHAAASTNSTTPNPASGSSLPHGVKQPTSSTPTTATATTAAPIATSGGKATVLEVGDSLGIDLGWGMQWALTNDGNVTLVQDAKGDSGLSNVGYYDWPSVLQSEVQATHPQVVVVFLGANDWQGFTDNGQVLEPGTPGWTAAYAQRVGTMMSEATSAGARVLWVGMPIMGPSSFSGEMQTLDGIYQSEAAKHPGATYYSSWSLFSTPSGQFNGGTTDVAGTASPLRDSDGIHLATGGEDLLGSAVVKELKSLYRLP